MADPFLLAHHVAPRVFNISGKLTPVSLKDQMIRGRLFVDRAYENGEISSAPDRGLLVIGGGACGITAAIQAAQYKVSATVVERSPRLFDLQAGCRTRWLDPAQYDWPLDHWTAGYFPWAGGTMPLYFPADWARSLAQLWWLHLPAAMAALGPTLKIHVMAQLAAGAPFSHTPGAPFIKVRYLTPAGMQVGSFGAVLVTTGFGTENPKVGSAFRGFAFWETDPLAKRNWGVPLGTTARVLISGAGDGALQDFLRITTRLNSAKEVFNACGIPLTIATALKDIERRTACSYHWGEHAGHDHALHMELEHAHGVQVASALANPVVLAKLKTLLVSRPKDLKLVHVCEHLTPYYGLNRFLTLLIAKYIEDEDGVSVLQRQTSVTRVTPAGPHNCTSNPTNCHGELHDVNFSSWGFCGDKKPGAFVSGSQFNVVIIRHGISPTPPAFAALTPVAQPRQVLPYYLL